VHWGLVGGNGSVLFFPKSERTETGEIESFQLGIGLIAGRLSVTDSIGLLDTRPKQSSDATHHAFE